MRGVRVAVITAAGESSRMGQPKALLDWKGRSVLASIVSCVRDADIDSILVITGADAELVEAEAASLGVETRYNEDHESGRFSSVRMGAQWATENECDGLLLWPIDCPEVCAATLAAVRSEHQRHSSSNIVPSHDRQGGHPILLSPFTFQAIAHQDGDANLRELVLQSPAGRRFVEVDDAGVLTNFNTPAEYEAARSKTE